MASKTTNYNLDMPAYNEIADIDVINGNMDKIDVQMKKNADSAQQSKDIVSDEYSATNTYAVGDYCIHENILYKCKTAITTGEAFDSNKWVQTTCGTEFGELNSNLVPKKIELQNVDERVTIQDNGSFIINGFAFVNLLVTFNETLPQWSNFVRLPRPKGGNVSVYCENSVMLAIYSQDNLPGDCGTTENVASGTEIRLLVNHEVA